MSSVSKTTGLLWCVLTAVLHHSAQAEQTADIVNFRQYTADFASSGQIEKKHLQQLSARGFQRIVYIAYRAHGSETDNLSIDQHATDLGLHYVHIPVPWQAPSIEHYRIFVAVMNSQPKARTLLHCQMNYRASAFSFLYRVLELNTPTNEALADLKGVWQPDATWSTFINSVLAAHNHATIKFNA